MSYVKPSQADIDQRRNQLANFDSINERVALSLFACILSTTDKWPRSYLDIGSGTGAMVNMARKVGIDAYGIDVINGPEHWFIHHDLSTPIQLLRTDNNDIEYIESDDQIAWGRTTSKPAQFDLITCIEVAEHIPEESSYILANTISRHLKQSGQLIFSSATPGQSGEHHINTKHPWQWRNIFFELNLSYRQDLTMQLSHIWSWVAGPLMWLGSNVQVFDK